VGGGLVVSEHRVVITQPTAGDFRAFSAICTHLGCTVTSVSDGTINCPCHGSRFSIEDGSVVEPALGSSAQQPPLPAAAITVNGDAIELA
jgi:Rieske Fe-S protein